MPERLRLTRDVTREECDWLDRDYRAGEIVWDYLGHTYGCCTDSGRAVSQEPDTPPFFELPEEALAGSPEWCGRFTTRRIPC